MEIFKKRLGKNLSGIVSAVTVLDSAQSCVSDNVLRARAIQSFHNFSFF